MEPNRQAYHDLENKCKGPFSFASDLRELRRFHAATFVRSGDSTVRVFSTVHLAESPAGESTALGLDVQDN
jgi:hypothetical protein